MVIMKRLWFMLVFLCCIALPLFPGGERESGGESASGRTNGNADLFSEEYANPIIKNETDDRLVVFDADGNEVTLTKRPERAIINYTSMLGLWYLAGGRAVGRPDTRGLKGVPEGAWDIETTGHVANPNLEKIISLEPDFVVLSGTMDIQRRIKEVLDQYEVENILLNYEHYHDFLNILDLFVRIVNGDGVVESLVPGIQTEVGRIIDSCRGFDPPRFLSLFASTRDVLVELNDSHTARIAAMLGGENIAGAVTPREGAKTDQLEYGAYCAGAARGNSRYRNGRYDGNTGQNERRLGGRSGMERSRCGQGGTCPLPSERPLPLQTKRAVSRGVYLHCGAPLSGHKR